MFTKKLAALALVGSLALAGCTVYVPTVPATPIARKGQVELSGGTMNFRALEGTAAWSPLNHVLLTVDGSLSAANRPKALANESVGQGSLGLGYYQLLGKVNPAYLAVVGGVGRASVSVDNSSVAFASSVGANVFTGHYQRYYGQVYAASTGAKQSMGLSVRGSWADYRRLSIDDQPSALRGAFFLEPHLFLKGGQEGLQGYLTLGFSMPMTETRIFPTELTPDNILVGMGLVIKPTMLYRRMGRASSEP